MWGGAIRGGGSLICTGQLGPTGVCFVESDSVYRCKFVCVCGGGGPYTPD